MGDHPLIKGTFSVSGNGGSLTGNGGSSTRRRRRRDPTTGGQSGCQDANGQCSYWAQNGECTRNPNYMLANCRCACNAGGSPTNSRRRRRDPTTGGQPGCQDANGQCAYWAQNGECT